MPAPLPPLPNSWYAVGFLSEFAVGSVNTRRLADEEVVVYRTGDGAVNVVEPYCPHLGAHFGHGGTVDDGCLRCPFHGFRFDATGACVSTAYGKKAPPKAKVHVWPVKVVHGVVMVYYHAHREAPDWEIPDVATQGWTPFHSSTLRLRSHPQEIAENSVDLGHLTVIHGYHNVRPLTELHLEGPYLNAQYAIHRPAGFFGKPGKGIRAEFEIHQHGLGYARVEVTTPDLGVNTRQLVMPTPVGNGEVELRIAMAIQNVTNPGKIHPILSVAPKKILTALIARSAMKQFEHDVLQDFPIWNNKQYTHPPVLADGDGPIGPYRKWSQQFYSKPAALLA